jgi:hypothetical protein
VNHGMIAQRYRLRSTMVGDDVPVTDLIAEG